MFGGHNEHWDRNGVFIISLNVHELYTGWSVGAKVPSGIGNRTMQVDIEYPIYDPVMAITTMDSKGHAIFDIGTIVTK